MVQSATLRFAAQIDERQKDVLLNDKGLFVFNANSPLTCDHLNVTHDLRQ